MEGQTRWTSLSMLLVSKTYCYNLDFLESRDAATQEA